MSVVTLPYKKFKAWQKMRLERKIVKWPEAQTVVTTHINVGSAVAAASSMAVSQAERIVVQVENTAMQINGAVAGDSETGRKEFMARKWAALIGFCGF